MANPIFEHAPKLTEKELQPVVELHLDLAQTIKMELEALFHTNLSLSFLGASENTYHSLMKSLPRPGCFAYLSPIGDPEESCYLHIDFTLALAAIYHLLGGKNKYPDIFHTFSQLEAALIKKFTQVFIKNINEKWSLFQVPLLNLSEITQDPKPRFHENPSLPLLTFSFSLSIDHQYGIVTIAYPLSRFALFRKVKADHPLSSRVIDWGEIPVEITAQLGTTLVSPKELTTLQTDDIIRLDNEHQEPIAINIHSMSILKGYPGLKEKHKAVALSAQKKRGDPMQNLSPSEIEALTKVMGPIHKEHMAQAKHSLSRSHFPQLQETISTASLAEEMQEIPIELEVILGRVQKKLKEVMTMGEGSILTLDTLAGEPVELFANRTKIAEGEVVIVDGNYAIRIQTVTGEAS